jgi:hypothetical protein
LAVGSPHLGWPDPGHDRLVAAGRSSPRPLEAQAKCRRERPARAAAARLSALANALTDGSPKTNFNSEQKANSKWLLSPSRRFPNPS